MTLPIIIYPAALMVALVCSAITLPLWRKWCFHSGLLDAPSERKIHDAPIPLAGGLAVFTGIAVPICLAALFLIVTGRLSHSAGLGQSPANSNAQGDYLYYLGYGFNRRLLEVAGIFFGAVGMLAIGFLDDKHELKPRTKFLGQSVIALLVAACGVRITLFIPNIYFSYFVTVLWILTLINAFNFMDNMNGLCAGLGAIGAGVFGSLAAQQDQYLVALLAFLTLGSLLGFLPYNFPRATAFLGDAGSHLVGYLMAILAILPHFYTQHHPRRVAVITPLLVLFIPLADLVCVVLIRWRAGRPFYQGDTNHISHRLVRTRMSKTRAVVIIWIAATLVGGVAFLL